MKLKISPLKFKKYLNGLVKIASDQFDAFNDSILGEVGGLPKRVSLGAFRSDKRVDLALSDIRKEGGLSPLITSIGSTPVIGAYEFEQVDSAMNFSIPIPFDYSGGKIELHLVQYLVSAESDGDVIEWGSDYIVVRDNRSGLASGSGGTLIKTNSSTTGSTTVVEDNNGNGVQEGTMYETVLEFDPNDADNPFDGKNGYHLFAEIKRSSIGVSPKVGQTALTHAYLKYK